ncbi:MAG: hypothetical protein LQ343_003541 [Gyalolechia ehrenbergii]|nr:MAG: hypothetical protein LQ343_003541 [Gyalolechia ehrenbergii]
MAHDPTHCVASTLVLSTTRTDTTVAITQFIVEAYRIAEIGRTTAQVPPQGFVRNYRNIELSIRPRPREPVSTRIADLVGVLSGIIYYMSYDPQGFTEADVDVYLRFQNPAIPSAFISEFTIKIVEQPSLDE